MQTTELLELSKNLNKLFNDVKTKKVDIKTSTELNKITRNIITVNKDIFLVERHQQIQRDKMKLYEMREETKRENITLQRERIVERQKR